MRVSMPPGMVSISVMQASYTAHREIQNAPVTAVTVRGDFSENPLFPTDPGRFRRPQRDPPFLPLPPS
jgi:hypothetical protein